MRMVVEKVVQIEFFEEYSEDRDGVFYRVWLNGRLLVGGCIDGNRDIDELMRKLYEEKMRRC